MVVTTLENRLLYQAGFGTSIENISQFYVWFIEVKGYLRVRKQRLFFSLVDCVPYTLFSCQKAYSWNKTFRISYKAYSSWTNQTVIAYNYIAEKSLVLHWISMIASAALWHLGYTLWDLKNYIDFMWKILSVSKNCLWPRQLWCKWPLTFLLTYSCVNIHNQQHILVMCAAAFYLIENYPLDVGPEFSAGIIQVCCDVSSHRSSCNLGSPHRYL